MAETLTRANLADSITQQVGLSRAESAHFVDLVLDEVADALVEGEVVKLSTFGTFAARQKNERIGRNPKTGVEVSIKPRRALSFRASHVLKNAVNGITTSAADRARDEG